MAVEFSRTTGAGGVMAVDFEIDMYAGALESGTRWLDGAAGAADAYPGSITGFQATNDDTTNTAGRGLKMVMGVLTLVQNANVFTVGGDADTIHAMVIGGSGVAGKSPDLHYQLHHRVEAPLQPCSQRVLWITEPYSWQ